MPELKTGVGLWASRWVTPKLGAQFATTMQETGTIDQMVIWDQLMNWFPQALWTPENSPMAAAVPDVDSVADPFTAMAFALSAVDDMGFAICCDALRREPAEMAQALLTLAMATEGQGSIFLGAGEARHITPFGRKRSIGLKRLEDALQVFRLLLKETGPVDHDGTVWHMKDAFIGNGGKDRQPEIIAMGGGPRLLDAALSYADGLSVGAPFVYADPEKLATAITGWKQELEKRGRDPEAFSFGLHHIVFICKDKDDFERHVDNPLVKWYAATGGRINQNDWDDEGIEPVMPRDWHYAFKMLPGAMTEKELLEVTDRVPPEMVRKTFFYGTPEEVAAEIKPFAEAGVDRHLVADVSGLIVETDPFGAIKQMGDICGMIKSG
ncbi:MAG: phthiodiolone/phenolphthiodiolone dimycocerosates ketoreductase [Solirubrobacteraceae bacterium]|jgi:phthiodiolone/phenolphthiodiolone dimycocerosates ketoreductase|nr:phthiodiolone/phenolphthiodiolone dimycocerosates ketoreductase [Solirubrobacteraceae bacterium]